MKISSSSESHFFQIIHSSIIQDKRLGLPKKFIGKFGEELSEVAVVMVPSGTIWRVELRKAEDDVKARSFKQTSSRAEFSAHRENRRIEPDELDDLSLQEKASAGVPTTTSYSTASRATHVKEGAHEAARAFKSENPFRTIIMRSSYVGKPFAVHVPVDFGRTYFKHKTGSITLCVSDGRMWQVRCAFGDYYTKLTSGWRDFVLDNHLEEDDVCVFELVDRNNFEVNVSIFRVSGDVV